MKNIILCLTVLLVSQSSIFSQVTTRIFREGQSVDNFLSVKITQSKEKYFQQPVDFEKILSKDAKEGRKLSRATVNVPVNYGLKHGQFTVQNDIAIWSIDFETEKARSVGFHFDDLALPPSAEMYVLLIVE